MICPRSPWTWSIYNATEPAAVAMAAGRGYIRGGVTKICSVLRRLRGSTKQERCRAETSALPTGIGINFCFCYQQQQQRRRRQRRSQRQ